MQVFDERYLVFTHRHERKGVSRTKCVVTKVGVKYYYVDAICEKYYEKGVKIDKITHKVVYDEHLGIDGLCYESEVQYIEIQEVNRLVGEAWQAISRIKHRKTREFLLKLNQCIKILSNEN